WCRSESETHYRQVVAAAGLSGHGLRDARADRVHMGCDGEGSWSSRRPPAAGEPLAGLRPGEVEYFFAGQDEFEEAEDIAEGMGPRMNLDSCGSCHLQPALG